VRRLAAALLPEVVPDPKAGLKLSRTPKWLPSFLAFPARIAVAPTKSVQERTPMESNATRPVAADDDRRVLPKHWKILVVAFMVFFAVISTPAQPPQAWVARYNGGFTNQIHTPLAMALDNSGNIYVAGSSQNAGNLYDYLVLKYAPGGTQLFAARFSSTNGANYTVNGFALDQNDNTYETGTGGTVKFASNGTVVWTAPYAGNDMAVDTNGNAYVTGFSTSTYATVKLDANGSNLWLQTHVDIYGYTPAISQKVGVDNAGHVYVAGYETWSDVLEHGILYNYAHLAVILYDGMGNALWTNAPEGGMKFGTTKAVLPDNQGNVYITGNSDDYWETGKLGPYGQTAWGFVYAPPGVAAMVIDTNGNVYLTGAVYGAFTYGTAYETIKLDNMGNLVWGSVYLGPSSSYTFNEANGIALDNIGNVYVTGVSTNTGTGTDFATIKYDNNGNQLWVARYNGPANGNDGANAIAVAPDGSVYVTGYSANASGGMDIVTIKYAGNTTILRQSNGSFLLQAAGSPGQNFDFQASTDLQAWQDLGTNTADTNGAVQFLDTNAPLFNHRFYLANPQ
jgi:hypothetical protein